MRENAPVDYAAEAATLEIVGVSAWAADIRKKVLAVAACPSNVLVTGPTGTGKEVIARAIHARGPRAQKPFIPVDCAAATGTLFASHIFGHLKGAFTGAGYAALGCFRAAHGGTIFLDEVGELESDMQTKLLRVLQQRRVIPVGGHEEVPVDVRVIAATNRDLRCEVAAKRFREDLYYRLHVVTLRTLPLRERGPRTSSILPATSYTSWRSLTACRQSDSPRPRWNDCTGATGRETSANWRTCWSAPHS